MRRYQPWLAILPLMLLPLRARAQAGPPYQTDDPDPVEFRHWEFYVATQDAKSSDDLSGTAPHIELNYGAVPRLQLHILVPLAYDHAMGGSTQYGVGDIEVGAKVQIVSEGRYRPMIGTFIQTEWPAEAGNSNLGTGHLHVLIPIWLQKSFGAWSTDAGGGYWINPGAGNRDYWAMGWEVGRKVSSHATVGAELYNTTADRAGATGSLVTNVGVVYDVSQLQHVLLSLGHSLRGERTVQGYLGYQLTWGPREQSDR